MDARAYYAYLCSAREQLWNFLKALPPAQLDQHLIGGERFSTLKDLLLHVTDVEDHWLHTRGLGHTPDPQFAHDWQVPHAEQYPLTWILEYAQTVQTRTQDFLNSVPDLERRVPLVSDDPEDGQVTLDQLLWHVMTHEVRHTAQMALMIRQLGHTPPWLDYLRFVRPLEG